MAYIFLLLIVFFLLFKDDCETGYSGKNATAGNRAVYVRCSPPRSVRFEFVNIASCMEAYRGFGVNSSCKAGCLGLLSCADVCPRGAISSSLDVSQDLCLGCGKCLDVCPLNLIEVSQKASARVFVKCSSEADGSCSSGCHRCYKCVDECPGGAVYVDENGKVLIDYDRCDGCMRCVKRCPPGVMKSI